MNEYYSKGTQIVAVIIAENISYILMILFNQYSDFLSVIPFPEWLELILDLLIIPLLCIISAVLFVYITYKCKLIYLLLCIPIIFICVLIYCPNGLYFLIMKGPFIYTPDFEYEKNWEYGIYISIEFLIVQSIPVLIVKGAQKYPTDEMIDEDEKDEKDK